MPPGCSARTGAAARIPDPFVRAVNRKFERSQGLARRGLRLAEEYPNDPLALDAVLWAIEEDGRPLRQEVRPGRQSVRSSGQAVDYQREAYTDLLLRLWP